MIDIREHGGSFGGNGLKATDKQALIDIVNNGESNQTTIKTDIANALNSKIGTSLTSGSAWIDVLNAIPSASAKKWLSGTVTSSSSTQNFHYAGSTSINSTYYVTVTGLTFEPSYVIITDSMEALTIYRANGTSYTKIVTTVQGTTVGLTGGISAYKANVLPASINSSGFVFPYISANKTCNWIAFE